MGYKKGLTRSWTKSKVVKSKRQPPLISEEKTTRGSKREMLNLEGKERTL